MPFFADCPPSNFFNIYMAMQTAVNFAVGQVQCIVFAMEDMNVEEDMKETVQQVDLGVMDILVNTF